MNLGGRREYGYKIEFNSRASELRGRFEIRRVGDPLFLRIRIRGSSSNIVHKLGRNGDTRTSSAAELVNSEER